MYNINVTSSSATPIDPLVYSKQVEDGMHVYLLGQLVSISEYYSSNDFPHYLTG